MQTSKFLLVIGVAMVLSAPSHALGKPDTEAQAKMREALRLKMEELNGQQSAPEAPAPVVDVPNPAPVAMPEEKPPEPKVVKVKRAPAKPRTVVVPLEAQVGAPANADFSEPVTESKSATALRMEEALRQKMAELNATPAVVVETPASVIEPQPSGLVAPTVSAAPVIFATPEPAKIEAPASPLPVTKQDRLAELLRRYKADQVTAQDYHSQRAAILAEQ